MRIVRCQCSRCKLYKRALDSDNPEYDLLEENLTKFETRDYQTALIEIAIQRNIIACLPTGSGKTFIALKLIQHFQNELLNDGKKVIFLANTIPLVAQQAEFFARNSILKVKHLTGDMEVDYWGADKWNRVVEGFNVLAMTTQIFLNIVRPAFIRLSQISLIIFDECHHAVKDHPMKHVMQKVHEAKMQEPTYPIPRILGMTATIIKGNCKEWEVPDRVVELEKTMQAKAVTYRNYEKVLKYSTSSRVETFRIPSQTDANFEWSDWADQLGIYAKELNKLRKERKKLKAVTNINGIDATLKSTENIYLSLKRPTAGDLRIVVDDVNYCCENLGQYCGVIAINLKLAFIEFSLLDINDEVMKIWYERVRDLFIRIRRYLKEQMNCFSDREKVLQFASVKVQKLVEVIKNEFGRNDSTTCPFDDDSGVCGIVFVDRRVTAQVLRWYLKDLSEMNKNYEFIRANFVVGTSRCAFESVESRIYAKNQKNTIDKFRTKGYNILIATSVLEEGIDVPSCNLIVRFDKIPSYTSFIQSMGRARKPNALYCAFIEDANFAKQSAELDEFQRINRAMVNYLIRNVEKVDEEVGPMTLEHSIQPFCPGGTADSPSLTLESATDVIDWYCNLLPCDGVSTLQTVSWWTEELGMYRGHLKLPMNSVLRGTVMGELMSNKGLARQAVHFVAAKKLFELDVLDKQLMPIRPALPDTIGAYFKTMTSISNPDCDVEEGELREKPATNVGGKQSVNETWFGPTSWYQKRIPQVFVNDIKPNELLKCKVYRMRFDLIESKPDAMWKNMYDFSGKGRGFGLVTIAEVPNIESFPLHGAFGVISASLERLPKFPVHNIPFEQVHKFQNFAFTEILGLNNRLLQTRMELPLFILPLLRKKGNWELDADLLNNIVSFSGVNRLKRPNEEMRKARRPLSIELYKQRFEDAVVAPWYKKSGANALIYCVESVDGSMNPCSDFHDYGVYKNYKSFIQEEYRTRVYDMTQPLLKTKLAGVGRGKKQLNYLLEKYAKEDEFPVILIPELVHKLPISASSFAQLKLIPSFLHRLGRLMLAREILLDISQHCDWSGILNKEHRSDDASRLSAEHYEKSNELKIRRQEFAERLRKAHKAIPKKQNIEERELHYEFIHPNEITEQDIQLFHEAVSDHSAAKKILKIDPALQADGENNKSKIELTPVENISVDKLETEVNFSKEGGLSLLAVMEALTLSKSNDGISNERLHRVGWAFLNFLVSTQAFLMHPTWSEPLLCQWRNRLLSIQYLSTIAKQKQLGEVLACSDFYPGDTWLWPGFELISAKADIGEIAARHKVPMRVYDELEINAIKEMTEEALDKYVMTNAPRFCQKRPEIFDQPSESKKRERKAAPKTGGVYSSYTHTEVSDVELARGLSALVGAFFIASGTSGALKVLDWLDFCVPNADGEKQKLIKPSSFPFCHETLNSKVVDDLLPMASELESRVGYTFVNRKLLLQALSHPTFLANDVTECYQRLEFLGDAILDALLTNHVFRMTVKKDGSDSKYTTTELSDVRASLVNNITYAALSVRYGLHKHLLSMSKALTDMIDNFIVHQEAVAHHCIGHFTLLSDEEVWGQRHIELPKVLGDIFESLAGAIFVDSGCSLDAVWKVFYRLMENEIDGFSAAIPKSPLQELLKEFPSQITFRNWTSKKIQSRGRNLMKITVGPHGNYFGAGTNLTRARFAAAKIALKMIKEEELFIKDRDATRIMLLC